MNVSYHLCILLVNFYLFTNFSGNNNKMFIRDFWVKIYKSLDVMAVVNCICANIFIVTVPVSFFTKNVSKI